MSYELDHNVDLESQERSQRQINLETWLMRHFQSDDDHGSAMTQEYIDSLERIDNKALSNKEECPICTIPFLEDQYPLVVCLTCPGHHKFDLECVSSWLKKNNTCPMCRWDLSKKKDTPITDLDDDEEYDDMYA